MSENEFLLYLSNLTISSEYNNDYFKRLFQVLCIFFKPDRITNNIFKRNGELKSTCDKELGPNDIVLNIASVNSRIVIRNPRRKLENRDYVITFIEVILNNIFKNKKIQDALRLAKDLDPLLSVYNRSAYEDLLKSNEPLDNVGVAFVDVNGLGVQNNMYGHEAGDLMLQTIANCIKRKFRMEDVYRVGGDEFVIVCENITEDCFNSKLEDLQELVGLTEYTVSVGSVYVKEVKDLKSVVEDANILMKGNKEKFRKEHPEKYLNKYEVTYVGKKGTSHLMN